ncbi:abortive infection family protein [Erythrobacter litoralis]|nr:abortive infection family protein [Erythrobacter litoralis]
MSAELRGAAKARLLMVDLVYSNFKAYELPALAERLGLKPGSESEAMSSKRSFMMSRLSALSVDELRAVAKVLSEDFANEQLDRFAITGSPSDDLISASLDKFDKSVVHKRWQTALERRSADPENAITLSRTLLEDVFKWILSESSVPFDDNLDMPKLYRLVANELRLAPDDHTEVAFKRILGSCQSIVESLATLRNRIGDAHGTGPRRIKPSSRHAELTVNLAGAMATFLVATFEDRKR